MDSSNHTVAGDVPKPRKLPDIPAEELALHGSKSGVASNGNSIANLPPEIHVQMLRHMRKRSRSLTGLDTVELEKRIGGDTSTENALPKQSGSLGSTADAEQNNSMAHSLPCSPSKFFHV